LRAIHLPQHPRCDFRIEPKPGLRTRAELDRAKLDRVGVHPGALDPKPPRQLSSIDQLSPLKSALLEQLDNPASDCLDRLRIEPDAGISSHGP
jgi:hypothetical protein